MTCDSIRAGLIEAARASAPPAPDVAPHLEVCAACAGFYRTQLALTPLLCGLPAIDPPAALQARVLSEFDRAHRQQPLTLAWRIGAVAALAAALAVGVAIIPRSAPQVAEQPFIEIPYVGPLAPYERTEIRRMDVPVAALTAVGFHVTTTGATASVPAEVLLGQDGRIHAVRINQLQGAIQ
jgi:hypothetical protein